MNNFDVGILLRFAKACVVFIIFLFGFYIVLPTTFQYTFSYIRLIVTMVYNDEQRHEIEEKLSWQQEFYLQEMEMLFNQQMCAKRQHPHLNVAWLTAMMNDNYAVGAIYLAYVIKKLSCHHKMIALVSDGVTKKSQDALKKAGYEVRNVEPLDCDWMDRRKGNIERHLGLPGTHMRFHAWNYTEYDSIVYLDPDVMPLNNIDELFWLDAEMAASYCARPGILDPCFNAGLLMFKPSSKSYNEIMNMWSHLSTGASCPNDQVLLWHYYADNNKWLPLPYAYNVRRYLYHPMKVYHFACCLTKKPWKMPQPTDIELQTFKGPLTEPNEVVLLWWKHFRDALAYFELNKWYEEIKNTI
ncbi:glycogenin-1 isoform X1 [Hydra vulgaris]|nr:glycogenin-1 isoform X2 [Hydra vulgaris]